MSSKLKIILTSFIFVIGSLPFAQSGEINVPGFTGSINTTVTSGFSMRTDRNCLSVRGSKSLGSSDTGGAYAAYVAANHSSNSAAFLNDGEGCATRYTDGYGNAGSANAGARDLISQNADNGRTNYDEGDIFDVTQRLYSEITGSLGNGTDVNISFVGSYNPLIDVSGNPSFAPFSAAQEDDIESDMKLLNAYVSTDVGDNASITAGRFVTSWGESTFIPVGMNGLTTNALDLTSLRVPGSSIKEALVPTEQITLSGYLDGGWSYEAYYQFGESHIEADEEGQFFGSDVLYGDRLIVSGQYTDNNPALANACGHLITTGLAAGGAAQACDADNALAYFNTAAAKLKTDQYLIQAGMQGVFGGANNHVLANKAGIIGYGAASSWGGPAGSIDSVGTLYAYAGISATAFENWDTYTRKGGTKAGSIDITNSGETFADGDDQYGLALRTYLDNVGTGVDLGIYYAQYDSKVPYLRLKGQQGIVAGDLLGVFTMAAAYGVGAVSNYTAGDFQGTPNISLTAAEQAGFTALGLALTNIAYSEAGCAAYQNPAAAQALYGVRSTPASNFAYSAEEKSNALSAYNYTAINGKLYHDSSKCYANAQDNGPGAMDFNTATTQMNAAAILGAAVTPLNAAEYEFIYPENLQVMGISANTNIGATTVQAEIAYRPDFPLATDGSDQGQQLSDAAGTTALLANAVANSVQASDKTAIALASYKAGNPTTTGDGTTWSTLVGDIKNFKRSTLPAIALSTVMAGDYYTTPFIEYDVISGTVGTTTSFSASHPVTATMGADSTVFLTELGFVHVDSLDDATNGGVARGGYRDGVGGEKCGGITKGGYTGSATTFNSLKALDGITHLGSGQTDPLFGNGSYCESKNSIDSTSMTYRLIGSATYNNIANTAWTFSPSFVWSHDFSGYGPVSLGGFVPGRQSLSLGGNLSKGDVRASLNYVNQLGDEQDNLAFDMDYLSASVSYAF